MITKLTDEQRQAIQRQSGAPVCAVDEATNTKAWLLPDETFQKVRALFNFEPSEQDAASRPTVLERLEGFVEQIEGATAFVTLKTEDGEELFGEYPAAELRAKGIQERRRFRCETLELDGQVQVSLEAIPDREASAEEDAINQRVDMLLEGGELDGDD